MWQNVAKCGKMWQVKLQPILLEHLGTIKIHQDMFKPRAGRNPFCRLCWVQNSICHRSGAANIVLGDSMVIHGHPWASMGYLAATLLDLAKSKIRLTSAIFCPSK